MAVKRKVKLSLLSGKKTAELDELVRIFMAVTGRRPTSAEVEAARKKLKGA